MHFHESGRLHLSSPRSCLRFSLTKHHHPTSASPKHEIKERHSWHCVTQRLNDYMQHALYIQLIRVLQYAAIASALASLCRRDWAGMDLIGPCLLVANNGSSGAHSPGLLFASGAHPVVAGPCFQIVLLRYKPSQHHGSVRTACAPVVRSAPHLI
mgnify:CR=1 FL=1